MTESEAIAKFKRTSVLWESATNTEIVEAVKVAIQALEEVKAYRAIGTVEECAYAKRKVHIAELATEHIEKMEKALKDYEAIGTIESFRELTEKAEPKKPLNIQEDTALFECPSCGRIQKILYQGFHCKECGQHLNWQ